MTIQSINEWVEVSEGKEKSLESIAKKVAPKLLKIIKELNSENRDLSDTDSKSPKEAGDSLYSTYKKFVRVYDSEFAKKL